MSFWLSKNDGIVERLSNLAHISWSNWMKWVFELSTENEDGSVTIPAKSVERWKRRIDTSYFDLSEAEKNSDRIEAIRYLVEIMNDELNKMYKIGTFIIFGDYIYFQTGNGRVKRVPFYALNKAYFLENYKSIIESFSTALRIKGEVDWDDWDDEWENKKLTENELKKVVFEYNERYNLGHKIIKRVKYKNYVAIQYGDLHCEISPVDDGKTDLNKVWLDKNYKLSTYELREMIDNLLEVMNK